MTKPLIGVNADYRPAKGDAPAYSYVAAGYFDSILEAGGLPILIPPYQTEEDIDQVLDRLDGLLLVGGADLDPRRDGWMLHPNVRLQDSRRESFDRCLISKAAERRMPVLGIGAGMQLLNVSQGGNLLLHIPEDRPNALPHADPLDPAHRHTLELKAGSIMERVYGDGELRVNSMHHMAVDEIAPGFEVTARCPDGIVEAIESIQSDWFALGTQFHPEAATASALDVRIFEEFLIGVGEFQGAMRLVA
ncbi:MAG: gamma-glutamyl-gamma-aminobutyrate hydrolase family protein [Planctomycetales bacterium]|nr:gamma-glutamyl-gamma-aminobutyrate hydrolase family protein [Planctomycetales bacterium]